MTQEHIISYKQYLTARIDALAESHKSYQDIANKTEEGHTRDLYHSMAAHILDTHRELSDALDLFLKTCDGPAPTALAVRTAVITAEHELLTTFSKVRTIPDLLQTIVAQTKRVSDNLNEARTALALRPIPVFDAHPLNITYEQEPNGSEAPTYSASTGRD